MTKTLAPDPETASTLFIGRWTVDILSSLYEKSHRHGELRRRLGGISQRMLTRNLRNLESTGLIARRVTRSKSVAVEYSLTKMGRTFIVPLAKLCAWADHHDKKLSAIIQFLDADEQSAEPVTSE